MIYGEIHYFYPRDGFYTSKLKLELAILPIHPFPNYSAIPMFHTFHLGLKGGIISN
jgi:hypothetical protein